MPQGGLEGRRKEEQSTTNWPSNRRFLNINVTLCNLYQCNVPLAYITSYFALVPFVGDVGWHNLVQFSLVVVTVTSSGLVAIKYELHWSIFGIEPPSFYYYYSKCYCSNWESRRFWWQIPCLRCIGSNHLYHYSTVRRRIHTPTTFGLETMFWPSWRILLFWQLQRSAVNAVDQALPTDPADTLPIQIWRIQQPNNLSDVSIILLLKRNMFTDVK